MCRTSRKPPVHVAVIMDGNGRWAEAHNLPRVAGHARGAARVSEIVAACPGLGVTHLTLFAFSTENWRRPLAEIEALLAIFGRQIRSQTEHLVRRDVRVRFLGRRDRVPQTLHALMDELESRTRDCQGVQVSIAIDYGGRDEVTRAVSALSRAVAEGCLAPKDISADLLESAFDTHGLPDPDLVIRTSAEQRISNFLLWQAAYAEYDFPSVAWPDFTADYLARALEVYRGRRRRFGGATAAVPGSPTTTGRPAP
jgi:undecaprenyl diphosphate synthase